MIYKQRFHSVFYDIDNNKYSIQIYKNVEDDAIVQDEELLLSSEAITIKYNSDDLFQPLKQSGCTINVLTPKVLTDLYTGELNKVVVKIFKNDSLFWFGFLTPNIYSSEFNSNSDLLSLEFIDCISQLENIKFKKFANVVTQGTAEDINSFFHIVRNGLQTIDTGHVINELYVHNSLSIDVDSDILKSLYIQVRNFIDEGGEAQSYKSVLEDILRYLGMTLIQFKDKYLMIDYEAIKAENYSFVKYILDGYGSESVTLTKDYRDITDIGIASANGTISLGNIYNKVSIVANNNPINDSLPEVFDSLTNQNADTNKYYETTKGDYKYLTAYFNSSEWETEKCFNYAEPINEVTLDLMMSGITTGTVFQKSDAYKIADGEPSSLKWVDYLTMIETSIFSSNTVAVKVSKDSVIYKGGYFIIDIEYMFSQSQIPTDTVTSSDAVFTQDKYTSTFEDTKFKTMLKIGDYYFDGKTWTTTESYFYLCRKNKEGEKIFNTAYHLTNQVSYTEALIDSGDGVLIKLPDFVLNGTLELQLYKPEKLGKSMNYRTDKPQDYTVAKCCHIKDIKFVYTTKNTHINVFDESANDDLDLLYENVINENNITELDDIKMKVNTYSPKAGSYSYVMTKTNDKYDFIGTVTKPNYIDKKKMEEFILEKYYNHFSTAKFIYSNILNNIDIKPYSVIHSGVIKRDMVVDSISYNLSDNSAEVTLKEI